MPEDAKRRWRLRAGEPCCCAGKPTHIGQMSCNPAVGEWARAPGQGDSSLGGAMARVNDQAGIQFRRPTPPRGRRSARHPRAVCDKARYRLVIAPHAEAVPNWTFKQYEADQTRRGRRPSSGVGNDDGIVVHAGRGDLDAGTFLRGRHSCGEKARADGRCAEGRTTAARLSARRWPRWLSA